MGHVHGHSFKHLRGRVGEFVYKHYGDRVVVTRVPRTTGKRSARQKASEAKFALASKYAEKARKDPELWAFYRKIVGQRKVPTRSVAIRDYLTKPEFNGAGIGDADGDEPRVTAWSKPNWKISRAEMEIRNPAGTVLEWGPAKRASVTGGWTYQMTGRRPAGGSFVVVVTAFDRLNKKATAHFAGTFGKERLKMLPSE